MSGGESKLGHKETRKQGVRAKSRALTLGISASIILALGIGGSILWLKGGEAKRSPKRTVNFKLPDHAGREWSEKDFLGKRVLLHFWASWCPPCTPEVPELVKLAREMPELNLLTVSLDDSWEAAEGVLLSKDRPPNLVSLLDLKRELPEQMGSFQYPETYLISEKGEVLFKWVGAQEWGEPKFRETLRAHLKASSVDFTR